MATRTRRRSRDRAGLPTAAHLPPRQGLGTPCFGCRQRIKPLHPRVPATLPAEGKRVVRGFRHPGCTVVVPL